MKLLIGILAVLAIIVLLVWLSIWALKQEMPDDLRASSSVKDFPLRNEVRDNGRLFEALPRFGFEVPFYRIREWTDREFWRASHWAERAEWALIEKRERPAVPGMLRQYQKAVRL